ncbi:MAG: exodeoxyribonuclease VII small subunit [Anaerolineae bacterium]
MTSDIAASSTPKSPDTGHSTEEIDAMSFEEAYEALEEVVGALESGEQSLDESLRLYERGSLLAERCNTLLAAAELRVRQIDEAGQDAGPLAL